MVPNDPLKKQLGENQERFPIEQDLKPPVSHTEKYASGLVWDKQSPVGCAGEARLILLLLERISGKRTSGLAEFATACLG